jgi:UDP-N-acetylbacillosamine N-acetyltransferase
VAKAVYIYGASGHGLVVADIAHACGYDEIVFLDDGDNDHLTFAEIVHDKQTPIAFGVGNNKQRSLLFKMVQLHGFEIVTLIHPSAIVSQSATIGLGSVVMPNAVVNAKAYVGSGSIINTGGIVEHECFVDDFVHISPRGALAGNVHVGKYSHIGLGASIIQNITIGENVIVGAGAVVIASIPNNCTAVGVPAKIISYVTL